MFRGIKAERFLLVKESEKDEGDEGITADNSEAKDEVHEIKVVDEIADLPEAAVKSLVERGMDFMIDLKAGDKVYCGNIDRTRKRLNSRHECATRMTSYSR